jgi:hypothetical protein
MNAQEFAAKTRLLLIEAGTICSPNFADLASPGANVTRLLKVLQERYGCQEAKIVIADDRLRRFNKHHADAESHLSPDRSSVLAALSMLARSSQPDETVVIYYCGHGYATSEDFYLCPAGVDLAKISETGIAGRELASVFRTVRCRGLLLVLDCCHAGSMNRHLGSLFPERDTSDFRVVLSAACDDELTWEFPQEQATAFTACLLKRLEDERGDSGIVHLSTLWQDLESDTTEWYRQRVNGAAGVPRSTAVKGGVEIGDPAIFVNPRQARGPISRRSLMYSKAYVQQKVRRAVVAVAILFVVLVLAAWFVNEHTYFLEPNDWGIALRQGHPVLRFPGFPRTIWVHELDPQALVKNAEPRTLFSEKVTTVSADLFRTQIHRDHQWRVALLFGDDRKAVSEILTLGDMPDLTAMQPLAISPFTAIPGGLRYELSQRLDQLSNSGKRDGQKFRVAALASLGSLPTLPKGSFNTNSDLHQLVLRYLSGDCTTDKKKYLLSFMTMAELPSGFFAAMASEKLLALGCTLETDELMQLLDAGLRNPIPNMNHSFYLMHLLGSKKINGPPVERPAEYHESIVRALSRNAGKTSFPEIIIRSNAASLLSLEIDSFPAITGGISCDQSWFDNISTLKSDFISPFARLAVRVCGKERSKILSQFPKDVAAYVVFVAAGWIPREELIPLIEKTAKSGSFRYFSLRPLCESAYADLLTSAIKVDLGGQDDGLQQAAVGCAALGNLSIAIPDTSVTFNNNSGFLRLLLRQKTNRQDVRKVVVAEILKFQLREIMALLFMGDNAGDKRANVIDEELVASLKAMAKEGVADRRYRASCAVVVIGEVGQVVDELLSPDIVRRSGALACVGVRSDLEHIVTVVAQKAKFPSTLGRVLGGKLALVKGYKDAETRVPNWAKAWRRRLYAEIKAGDPELQDIWTRIAREAEGIPTWFQTI